MSSKNKLTLLEPFLPALQNKLKQAPHDIASLRLLGNIYRMQGDSDDAQKVPSASIPKFTPVFNALVSKYYGLWKEELSLKQQEKIIRQHGQIMKRFGYL